MFRERLDTKAARLAHRDAEIASLGAIRTDYPDADCIIATYERHGRYLVKCYAGTAGRAPEIAYKTQEARAHAIEVCVNRRRARLEVEVEHREKTPRTLSGVAATAKAIRAALRAEFPEVKFSVTSDTFAGGDSVHISWTDGPVCALVDAITAPYQRGSFDGMTDIYTYHRIDPALGCPGAKYVQTSREQSQERKDELRAHYDANTFSVNCMENGRFNVWRYENSTPECWPEIYQQRRARLQAERAAAHEEEAERLHPAKEPRTISFAEFVKRASQ